MNSAKDAVLLLDSGVCVQWANRAAVEFFSRDDLEGLWMGDLFPSIRRESLEAAARSGVEAGWAAVSMDGRRADVRMAPADGGLAVWITAESGDQPALRIAAGAAFDGEYQTEWREGNAHGTHAAGCAQCDGAARSLFGSAGVDRQEGCWKEGSGVETRETEEALRAVIDGAGMAILSTDAERRVVVWNRAAERLFGHSYGEMAGAPVPFDLEFDWPEAMQDLRLERADGRKIDVFCSHSAIRSEQGALRGYVAMFSDITERKRAQRQMEHLQRMESLGVLAGGVAHDFNNLLTGIMGNASLAILMAEDGSVVRPLLDEIVHAGERAAMLTFQLLAYAGKGRLVATSIDLNGIARDALATAQKLIVLGGVRLALELEENLPKIEADPAQMQQAMVNLIVNGMEAFGPEESGFVTVKTRRETVGEAHQGGWEAGDVAAPGDYAVFEVIDTGFGIDEGTRARMFEPFFSTKFTGRGLGLSAVLGIVRQHKGVLSVKTSPGCGATVSMFIPSAGHSALRDAALRDLESAGSNLILVIDDEQAVRETVRRALECWDYGVVLAENGQAAAEIFPTIAARVRAVVIDLRMPVMGGEEALKHLRSIRPDVPVILTSAFPADRAMQRMSGSGVTVFLPKPFTPEEMVKRVREILDDLDVG